MKRMTMNYTQLLQAYQALQERVSALEGAVAIQPPTRSRQTDIVPEACLAGGGEMGALMRALDWVHTPIGPVASWSPSLRMMVRFLLANRFPLLLWWGPQYVSIYNDAYRPVLGTKHPWALGQPVSTCWSEIWHVLQPLIDTPFHGGPATWIEDLALEINRFGFVEETHFTVAYSPVPDETSPNGIGGVLATVHEISDKVVGERRVAVLKDLGARSSEAKTAEDACAIAAKILMQHPRDIPFALLYLLDADGQHARLAGAVGVPEGAPASPLVIDLSADTGTGGVWPLAEAVRAETLQVVDDLATRCDPIPPGPWSDPPQVAVVVPIRSNIAHQLAGLLVGGISARLRFDELYRSFLELVTTQIATAIANARAYEEERKRAEALAELDRAKTAFFSNVSHEFRTPLTLMLGPLEQALSAGDGALTPPQRAELDVVHRNGLRLLKLVNTLLDFSRIEAGRIEASYAPTDLAACTADLASVFRSAIERAGLRLVVNCPPLPEAVYVDRDMWEKIVLNLLSNAFKFTFAGEIAVSLSWGGAHVALTVRDTGTGIPAHELPHIFERFHRIRGAPARTHEGTGIGLALVQELVKLHGGTVRADSVLGEGSTFTVTIPLGKAHLDPQRIGKEPELASTAVASLAFVEEVLRWLPDDDSAPSGEPTFALALASADRDCPGGQPAGRRARILWADDNADMRNYVSRLLGGRFDVQTVADGQAALEAARANPPDLVLSDVMMPRLDGFGLLRALRADPQLREIPLILLSARAGEESRIEGVESGADDYLIKPFSARELVARVETHVKMSRLRREADAARHESESRLATLVSSLSGIAYRCRNDSQWTMEFVSAGVINITGYTPDDLTSGRMRWAQLQHPDDVEWTWKARQSAAREHQPFQFEYRIRHKDGSERWVWEQGQGVYNEADEPFAFEGFVVDFTERKRAEAASATLAAIVESSDDAIISKSLDGVITSWNQSAERMFGYTASEAVGQPITMLIPPDRLDEEAKILEQLKRGERVDHFETIRVRKDGSLLDISLTISPVKDADGRIVGASKVARDITERKQVEAALRSREQELADFFDNAALGLHWIGPDGIILRVNQAELTLLGYTRDEYVGRRIAEFHADQHVIEDILQRLHAGEELHDYEARLVCKDGTIKHVLIDSNVLWEQGQFIHTRCFTRDITAQKQAEELLRQAHTTLEQRIAERTALLALIQDVTRAANEASTSAGALQYALDRFCAYTGWPIGHVYLAVSPGAERWAPTALWHLDTPERFMVFQQATQTLEVAADEDLIGRVGARGQPEWQSAVATDPTFHRRYAAQAAGLNTGVAWPVFVGPEVAGVLEFYTPEALAPHPALLEVMTQIGIQVGRAFERERAATQAQRQQETLLQQEKLAAMSTMLASVAHELNNPLATILLQAELLGNDVRGGPLAEPVTEIAQAAARCERLVRQFLTLARQHPSERAVVALNTLVADTVALLAYPFQVDNVAVHLSLDDQLPLLWGDPHQLQQVLINLLTNAQQALRAAPGAREVTCTTQHGPAQHQITLLVTDTGPGIPPALQARIFEPFFTTKPPGVGTGLGLPLCRGIVEAHGGTLDVTSAPGHGATFRLTLPVGAVPAAVLTPPSVDEALAGRGGTILVVDDEPSLASGLARLLRRDGHTVDIAANGCLALTMLEARAYDCILCDMRMPELDGPSLYRLLERQQPHLCPRLIFLTGDTLEPATQAFLEQSGALCLTKPFRIAEARRVIQRILLAATPSPPVIAPLADSPGAS